MGLGNSSEQIFNQECGQVYTGQQTPELFSGKHPSRLREPYPEVVGSASGCVQAEFLFSKAVSLSPGSGRTSGGASTVLGEEGLR